MSTADRYDPTTWSPSAWRWFVYGYERGVRSGIELGYADGYADGEFAQAARQGPIPPNNDDMIGRALAHVAAQKATREAERRPARVALTAEQIRDAAAASWGLSQHAQESAA